MSKKLFTSYYAKSGSDPLAFATSSKIPTYIPNLRVFNALAPKWEFVLEQIKGTITWDQYIDRYMDLLINVRKLNANQIVDVLPDGAILLCYEKSDEMDQCHRRLAADWIESETGIIVPELGWESQTSPLQELIEW